MRAFIAIEIPDAVKSGMADAQTRQRRAGVDAGWTRPEGIHLTLKFLGEIGDEQAQATLRALTEGLGAAGSLQLGIEGVGTFPEARSARIVWVGLTGDVARLAALQAAVERAAVDVGFEPETRPFTPHLTLGRIKRIDDRARWLKALEGLKDFKLPGFTVTSVSLMQSELRPAGAVYRQIGGVALG